MTRGRLPVGWLPAAWLPAAWLPAAMLMAALLVAGCSGSGGSSHGPAAASTGATATSGRDCLSTLHRATAATLAASSLTLTEDPWRERPADPTVTGGGSVVVTYQAPDRSHAVPRRPAGMHAPVVEQITIGRRGWEGSDASGWVAYSTPRAPDVLAWLRVPAVARRATSAGSGCAFTATVAQGRVVGQATFDRGTISSLVMTLTTHLATIDMSYHVTRVGTTPAIHPPHTGPPTGRPATRPPATRSPDTTKAGTTSTT